MVSSLWLNTSPIYSCTTFDFCQIGQCSSPKLDWIFGNCWNGSFYTQMPYLSLSQQQQSSVVEASYIYCTFRQEMNSICSKYTNLVSSDVATCRCKALGKGSHQNVNILWIAVPVVNHTPAMRTGCPDAMSLIKVQIRLVLFLQSDHVW